MKIVIAPDSFKGSLSATQVCDTIAEVAGGVFPDAEIVKLPIADGGEGLVAALVSATGGQIVSQRVSDPLNREITAGYGILPDGTAVIEMAAASGLPLLKDDERNPLLTTTYGTGQLMADALARGCTAFILGLGGSATTDGGLGAAAALGIRFVDRDGHEVPRTGGGLARVAAVDTAELNPRWRKVQVTFACDVDNPLTGPRGSSAVFGPQKGADEEMVATLDQGLAHFNQILGEVTGQDNDNIPGIGAAGGFALPFVALLNAELKPGLDIVLDTLHFDEVIDQADLIITGEGKTDDQSAMGKVLSGVSARGAARSVPVVALSGALGEGFEKLYALGLTAAFSCWQAGRDLTWQLAHAQTNLQRTAQNVLGLLEPFMSQEKH